jgi:hypothetical protein
MIRIPLRHFRCTSANQTVNVILPFPLNHLKAEEYAPVSDLPIYEFAVRLC